ncbi:uncharacterized protein IL334_006530 [Kwoniella shivajii]|uniref:F-box domain-containing protein n=1 Tax=Kwoniella shivajii TaxID=564305 RepID=A0ABZ1D6J5_9TREE|nr:hypothetical protein IL334_006530 [Kwoniella shivajii]
MLKRTRSTSPSWEYAKSCSRQPRSSVGGDLEGEEQDVDNRVRQKAMDLEKKTISDLFPLQEIFLRILSFLPPNDLAKIQGVNKYWGRMSVDPQLWKRLYLARYPHPHHSRLIYSLPVSEIYTTKTTSPRPLRPIARLPSRAFPPPSPKRSPSLAEGQLTPASLGRPPLIGMREAVSHATSSHSKGTMEVDRATEGEQEEVGHGIRNDGVDWKSMLKLGTNWSNGNALSQSTIPLPPSPSPSIRSETPSTFIPTLSLSSPTSQHRNDGVSEQHIALSPSYIFISSPTSPLVQVHSSSTSTSMSTSTLTSNMPIGIIPPPPGWSNPRRPDNVTCIVSDQSVIPTNDDESISISISSSMIGQNQLPTRIGIFYQSGGFVILIIRPSSSNGISWKRELINPPNIRPISIKRRSTIHELVQGDPVVLSTLYWPLLISCTRDFHLSIYSLSTVSSSSSPSGQEVGVTPRPKHLQTLRSEVSFHPAHLSLFPCPDASDENQSNRNIRNDVTEESRFRAALTYCTPLYPSSWTIAVQELSIDLSPSISVFDMIRRGETFHVGRNDDDDEDEFVWPRKVRPVVGVKGKAVGIGSDGRWCILAGQENKIQVFSLPHHDDQGIFHSAHRMKKESHQFITHSQTLLAHSSDITSLALNSGRCVSSARDGRILVWELDEEYTSPPNGSGKVGRTIGYVEVKPGGRRSGSQWRGPTGPRNELASNNEGDSDDKEEQASGLQLQLPHPQAISSAARSLFLPRPPVQVDYQDDKPSIRYLTFDEEKIVGLVRNRSDANGEEDETMKVWSFS